MPGLEESISRDTSPPTHSLMSDGIVSEQVKKFLFTSRKTQDNIQCNESLEIYILELLQANYSFYTWPSAPVLAWFLWEHKEELIGKRVLELGSGTALPGILASKCGAIVTLSDSASFPRSLQHIRRSCELNGILSQVQIVGITWGLFLSSLFSIGPLDLILGSDCFYEPALFEDIVVTVAFLLERNPNAKFLCTYHERSADWSIEHLLNKWNLTCTHISLAGLGTDSDINIHELMQDHTIHLLSIQRAA
ncbi:histone-arginine methyltransferase METTL23 [Bombus affinis]|uniref:Probable methyltransferase-like protein 23 n=1 Tax=Bombus terrestris TaxID=30195 RepID=A0A9B0C0H9_BOMTE|nr:probable methyltransferase-like protein 23 [Bombus terrestris]XP_043594764.1 methyltransferase-like protein 23 [Bombus pyrosoma]XP_050580467.1 histone-arginine methyltransferase METTL23 [Bombus affinis]